MREFFTVIVYSFIGLTCVALIARIIQTPMTPMAALATFSLTCAYGFWDIGRAKEGK